MTESASSAPGPHAPVSAAGGSPLPMLLDRFGDEAIEEIMVNGPGPVWIERAGALECTDTWLDAHAVSLLVEHIVAPLGLRADRSAPIVDARLADGSRVHIVVPPLAVRGPSISIRRFPQRVLPLAAFGPPDLEAVLTDLVADGGSILVVGPTSSGKTSLIAGLVAKLAPVERLVVIEDTAELPLAHPHQVRLEARPANSEGIGQVTLRQLVLAALRMRPDRLVVGEVRGAEAFDLLLALTSGHRGCLTSCHAAGVEHGLRRIETLASLAGSGLATRRLQELVFDGLDAVVVTGRSGPHRGVREVARVEPDGSVVPLWPRPLSNGRPTHPIQTPGEAA